MDTFADDLTRILDAFRSERERLKTEYERTAKDARI